MSEPTSYTFIVMTIVPRLQNSFGSSVDIQQWASARYRWSVMAIGMYIDESVNSAEIGGRS